MHIKVAHAKPGKQREHLKTQLQGTGTKVTRDCAKTIHLVPSGSPILYDRLCPLAP
ncbi:hypothetical protein WOLCODRAFT_29753 [Wolfiporia cocos MD-104 SS10]|uniref:Uncharacterized protein n=1 Tax=Wolfiporia cocos (strain MD-104) TaxID=742152 RepID=A0A2H3J604_WOLCO|nr:hypothetical protein WOLCODRAFT_29753 [Wolfiporia cocos MD-104 SS10]